MDKAFGLYPNREELCRLAVINSPHIGTIGQAPVKGYISHFQIRYWIGDKTFLAAKDKVVQLTPGQRFDVWLDIVITYPIGPATIRAYCEYDMLRNGVVQWHAITNEVVYHIPEPPPWWVGGWDIMGGLTFPYGLQESGTWSIDLQLWGEVL